MGDIYQYPVFFECENLHEDQIKKIQNYFRIRRRSGGGECEPPRSLDNKIYRIAFKHQRDQQAVLQRYEHVVGDLVFTVRGSLELQTSTSNITSTASQDSTPPAQSPQSIPDPIPPPSGEEYELPFDSYLCRYLEESPEAEKKLERDLASMACSAKFYPEEEKVLVRSLAQPGAAEEVQGWKTKIDKLFDGYLCYYEMDSRKIKALLQSCSSCQTTDEVKVYSEVGMAIVAGTYSQVNAKLMEVEDRLHLSEKQTSICLLGEAKLRLLWKEIELGLRKDFPGVKIKLGDAGQLVLEGPVEEILKAGDWISEKEKLVSEKKVSDKSPHFLTFLKTTYGGPGELGDFLQVGDQVEIELQDTEIRFFAFSACKLDETAKKLDENLREVKIDVPYFLTVPSVLCEKLKSKTNELNQVQHKAQVVFGSDSSVCLLGHAKEVDELRKTVTQFIQICLENNAQRLLGFQLDAADQDSAGGATAGDEEKEGGVRVEIIQGTIEIQQVDAVVSPMVGSDPLSTRVGNALYEMVGRQLTARFSQEAGEETQPGCTVLVEGFHPELSSNSVFFLSLIPWNDDEDGVAVQVLRLGINNILTSCGNRGITSVAFPLLGAGIALRFPCDVVAKVLLEEIHEFEQSRDSRAPLLVHIVIHPNDGESYEVFKSIQEDFRWKGFTEDVCQPEQESTTRRIILLGKTGAGKSNLAKTIFGEKLFNTDHSPNSGTSKCQAETRCVNGRSITLIDTPSFFDANRSEEDIKPEIVRCITESAPGPHAFLIVLKVGKYTEQEQAVFAKICQHFSADAFKYAAVVFTHGDQLLEGMKIKEFVSQNKNLSDLVEMCGGRCHIIDNKYWKDKEEDNYRNNKLQVAELLNTIDKIVEANQGNCYTNEMLQVVNRVIQREEGQIGQTTGKMLEGEIGNKAKMSVFHGILNRSAGITTGMLLGALLGVASTATSLQDILGFLATAEGKIKVLTAAQAGGRTGYNAAAEAQSPVEAMQKAAKAVWNQYQM